MNGSKLAPALAAVAALGIVGGIAAAQAFKPADKPQQVQFVQPAGETVTQTPTVAVVTPSATATTSAPVKAVKVAVESTPTATTTSAAPKPVQRQAVVSSNPTPTTSETPYTPPPGSAADAMKQKLATPPPPPPSK
jgi:hypothetical protein